MSSLRKAVVELLQKALESQKAELKAVRSARSEHLTKASELASEATELRKAIEETSEMIRNLEK